MAIPKSVTRVDKKGGITYTSSVDAVNYTINELSRAALRDCAKMLRKKMILKLKKLPGLSKSRRPYKSTQYWVRSKEADLQIGFGNSKKGTSGDTWYAIQQELGSKNQPKRGIMRDTVFENIEEMRKIQAQYLSAIKDKLQAERLIDESEAKSGDGEE
jgi:HK97 gp10 family phage protein